MRKQRNLLQEMNMEGRRDKPFGSLDANCSNIRERVYQTIRADSSVAERKIIKMKQKKKFALIAAAAILVLGITGFAASGVITGWYSSSSSIPDYRSLPTVKQCEKDIGYSPVLIDSFENGYTFQEGSVVSNELRDDQNYSVEKFKSVTFRYERSGDEVIVSQEKFNSEMEVSGDQIAEYEGIAVYYDCYRNKCVDPDYQMTEEEKREEAAGELVFSYGVEKPEIDTVQSVSFEKNGLHCQIMQINGRLSADELAGMAEEMIAA